MAPELFPLSCRSVLHLAWDVLLAVVLFVPAVLAAILLHLVPSRLKDLKDKVILITGAGNGLGRELALQCCQLGAVVVCVDLNRVDNEETVRRIEGVGKGAGRAFTCDVSNLDEVSRLVSTVLQELGRVDILVNNAGVIMKNGATDGKAESIVKVLHVNVLAGMWLIRSLLPHMAARGSGHIVTVGSLSGVHGMARGNSYSASKFAVLGMMESLREEVAVTDKYKNIKLSTALPYFVDSNPLYHGMFRSRLGLLSKQTAVSCLLRGIRTESEVYTIPGRELGYIFTLFIRMCPSWYYRYIRSTFYCDFVPDKEHAGVP